MKENRRQVSADRVRHIELHFRVRLGTSLHSKESVNWLIRKINGEKVFHWCKIHYVRYEISYAIRSIIRRMWISAANEETVDVIVNSLHKGLFRKKIVTSVAFNLSLFLSNSGTDFWLWTRFVLVLLLIDSDNGAVFSITLLTT